MNRFTIVEIQFITDNRKSRRINRSLVSFDHPKGAEPAMMVGGPSSCAIEKILLECLWLSRFSPCFLTRQIVVPPDRSPQPDAPALWPDAA